MKTCLVLIGLAAPLAALAQAPAQAPAAGAMSIGAWLAVLALGATAGGVGQLVRAVSGFAKLNGEVQFQPSKLVVSLMIGATAGALAAVPLLAGQPNPDTPTILGLMGAGYAGADFIEGFAGKYLQGGAGAGAGAIELDRMRQEVRQLANQQLAITQQLQAPNPSPSALPAPQRDQAVG